MEQIIQITVIFTFIVSIVVFFVKLGEYKSIINTDIENTKKDIVTVRADIKSIEEDMEKIKSDTRQATSNLEAVLIEIKTKLELLMQYSGMFNGRENNKK